MKYILLAMLFNVLTFSPASADALDWVTGAWGVDVENIPEGLDAKAMDELRGCKNSPVIITANRETMRYSAVHTGSDNFTSTAPILGVEDKWVSLRYDDEDRLMKNGEPQIWHMFFVSPDKFYWIVGPGIQKHERDGIVSVARIRCQTIFS